MKNKKSILIIGIISLILMIPVIINYKYVGHDFEFHFLNVKAIMNQMSLTNPFVNEPIGLIANGFGYGTRFFYPSLPHLLTTLIGKICLNNPFYGIKVTEWFTIFLSGITFYYLCMKLFKNKKTSLIGSIMYMATPYHLSEMVIRDALSEIFIFVSIPMIILGLLELFDGNYKRFYLFFILGYVTSCYSHIAMTIYFTLILLLPLLILYYKKIFEKNNLKHLLISCLAIILLISPIVISILKMKLMGNYAVFVPYYMTGKGDLINSTIKLVDLFKFDLPHSFDCIRFEFHFIVTIFIAFSLFKFIKNKFYKTNKNYLFFIIFFVISAIMTTKLFPWQLTPDSLATLQFPWRLTLYVGFSGIIVALFFINSIKVTNLKTISIILLIILSSFYTTFHLNKEFDDTKINYDLGMGNQKEYLPYNTIKNIDYFNSRNKEIIASKNINIEVLEDTVLNLKFKMDNVIEETIIEFPRIYYPGYKLKCENKKINIYENDKGFIEAQVNTNGVCYLYY